MKRRTTRLILDCMMCDAMSPEFKTANDILLRIIKLNDRTDGIPYPRLVEINKAFKSNDAKAAKVAYDKLAAFIPKGEKTLKDDLEESKSKLAETTKAIDAAKKNLADGKAFSALFDKFVKAIDTAKANPKALPKLKPYADKLKAYGDFAKRIEVAIQMDKAGKDVAKQCDMLKKAVSDGKAKYAKTLKALSDEFSKAKNRLDVYKEAVKIRTSKIADFAKEKDEMKTLGTVLPVSVVNAKAEKEKGKKPSRTRKGKELSPEQQKALEYVDTVVAKQLREGSEAFKQYDAKYEATKKALLDKMKDARRAAKDIIKPLSALQVFNPNYSVKVENIIDVINRNLAEGRFVTEPDVSYLDELLSELAGTAKYSSSESVVEQSKELSKLQRKLIPKLNLVAQTEWGFDPWQLLNKAPREAAHFQTLFDVQLAKLGKVAIWVKENVPGFKWKGAVVNEKDFDNPEQFLNEFKEHIKKAKVKQA